MARVNLSGVTSAASDRYVDVATALLLPLVALGIEFVARRQLVFAVAALVLLAVGVPGNVNLLSKMSPLTRGQPTFVKGAAHSPFLRQLPAGMRLTPSEFAPDMAPTVQWLRDEAAAGRIPQPSNWTPQLMLTTDLRLALQPGASGAVVCPATSAPRRAVVKRGDHIDFSGTIVVYAVAGKVRSNPVLFRADTEGRLNVVAGPLQIVMASVGGGAPALC